MSTIEKHSGMSVLVIGAATLAPHLAERTLRGAQQAGYPAEDYSRREPADLAARLTTARAPVWLVRAGGWFGGERATVAPPASATGQPVCALGWPLASLLDGDPTPAPDAPNAGQQGWPSDLDLISQWRRFYRQTAGDLASSLLTETALPPVLSVWLDPAMARQVGVAIRPPLSLEQSLQAALQQRPCRLVRYAPLDLPFSIGLRVAQFVTSLQRGGAERVVVDLARAFAWSGVHCRVVSIGSPTREPFPSPPGAIDLSRWPRDRAFRVAKALEIIRADGCDIVHAHLLDRADLAQVSAAGVPVVATVHNTRSGWQAGQAEVQFDECDLLVACAQAVEREFAATTCPVPLRTVWNGIDTREIGRAGCDPEQRQAFRREYQIDDQDLVLLTLANPRPQKRFPLLPPIVAALQQQLASLGRKTRVRLLLAGEPAAVHPEAQRVVAETKAGVERLGLQDSVTWLGGVANVSRIIAGADVLISASGHEGLSLAYVEALSAGLPVVATDVGGTRELLGPEVPLRLVPVDFTPDEFARAILACYLPRERRPVLLPDFSLERMAERYHWLYPRVIAAHRRRRQSGSERRGLWLVTNNFSTGGAQSSARRLLTAFARAGIPVRAAVVQEEATHTTPGLQALRAAGVPVVILPAVGTLDTAEIASRLLDAIDDDPPQSVVFWNLIPELKVLLADGLFDLPVFDVSPGEMYYASLERYFSRPRPGLPYRTPADYGRRLRGVIVKYSAEAPLAESSLTAPVHVIPNGVPLAPPMVHAARGSPLVLGTSARISPQKRLEDLLEAVQQAHARMPPYVLRIAGAPETGSEAYAAELRKLARDLPVEWCGEVTDIPGFLGTLDLFVQISEPAGCPNASLEALAAGLPIVATDVGGASEQVLDGVTGRLLPRQNAVAFAEALVELAGNPSLREEFGRAGHAHAVRHFSLERMVADYRRVCLGLES
ncbi:MAG: glycosyltransferase family 4 protein [Planctomycetes bacterium]|nr:glycosyltransferase family 4 protein [Planctomycetota bacterium]